MSQLKPQLFIHVNDGDRFRISFHECGGNGSKNVFLPLTVDQSRLRNFETFKLKMLLLWFSLRTLAARANC